MNTWVSPWAIGTHFSHQHMGTFLPSDSHLMVYFTTWEMHGFSHQFLIALENAAKSTLWTLMLFFHSMIVPTCFKIWWFLERENRKSGKINSFFFFEKKKYQFQACWNSKQNISKEEEGIDVISPKGGI